MSRLLAKGSEAFSVNFASQLLNKCDRPASGPAAKSKSVDSQGLRRGEGASCHPYIQPVKPDQWREHDRREYAPRPGAHRFGAWKKGALRAGEETVSVVELIRTLDERGTSVASLSEGQRVTRLISRC